MSHWIVKHGIQVLIGVLITGLLSGIGYVAWHACKIPEMELKLKAHDDKLTTIRTYLILLMSKSGPLDDKQLKDLVSGIEEIGKAKAGFVQNARVLEGGGTIPLFNWMPEELKSMFAFSMKKGQTVRDKGKIAAIISGSTIAQDGATWSVEDNKLIAAYGPTKVAFTAEKRTGPRVFETWVTELNNLSSAAAEIKKAKEQKQE